MSRSGQARILNDSQQDYLFCQIAKHRYPEKNRVIMMLSFRLALRCQEIALLQLKEVCTLAPYRKSSPREFKINEILSLPASITKGADALGKSLNYKRRSVSFKLEEFDRILKQVENLAKAGVEVNPTDFYPPPRTRKGKSRDLPLVDLELRQSLEDYIHLRLAKNPEADKTDPLILSQRGGGAYTPKGLQEHMSMMLRDWTGIEKASSHSGRRTVITNVIQKQKRSIKVAQKIAGHKSPSTTVIYDEPAEEILSDALEDIKK